MSRKLTGYRLQVTVIIFLLLPVAYSLLPTPVYAQECIDDEPCNEDTYYTDETINECVHKHGGFCNLETNQCEYAYDPAEESQCVTEPVEPVDPEEPITPPVPQIPTTPPPEEQAVYSQSQGLLPYAVGQITCQLNFLQKFIKAIFNIDFCDPEKFTNQSKLLHQSELPAEFTPTGSEKNQLEKSLGGNIGIYGATLPFPPADVKESEKLYEKSHFPAGIRPITGQ